MIWHPGQLFKAMQRRITLMRYAKQEDIAIIGNQLIVWAMLVTGGHSPLMTGCVALRSGTDRGHGMGRMQAAVRIGSVTGSLGDAAGPTGGRLDIHNQWAIRPVMLTAGQGRKEHRAIWRNAVDQRVDHRLGSAFDVPDP